jgi:glycosyltransferase involved in cell wall biosynthesis
LIITYYWPPAGGPGVQRVLKFVKYLPQFGWEPVVLTVANGEYPAIDHSLEKDIPEGIKVYKTKTIEPFSIFKFFKKEKNIPTYILNEHGNKIFKLIRFYLFPIDARQLWCRIAVRKGLEIIKEDKPILIFTSSPPHSINKIGLALKLKTGLPWVADFRDPWTNAFWLKDLKKYNYPYSKNKYWEKKVIDFSDAVITISQLYAKEFLTKKDKFQIIPNGFESNLKKNIIKSKDNFKIGFFGTWSPVQYPKHFFNALKSISVSHKIEFHVWGNIAPEIIKKIRSHELNNIFKINGYVKHQEAVEQMQNMNLLVFFTPNNIEGGMIPLKVFEYLSSNTSIMGVVNNNTEVTKLIESAGIGKVFQYHDKSIEQYLLNLIINQKDLPQPNLDFINQFKIENLTLKLSEVFNSSI